GGGPLRNGIRADGAFAPPLPFPPFLPFLPFPPFVPFLPSRLSFLPFRLPFLPSRLPAFCLVRVTDSKNHLPHFHLIPRLHLDLADRSSDRRRHFNRRLVRSALQDRLLHRHRVTGIHEDTEDVAGGNVFTKVGKCEIAHRGSAPRQWLMASG